MRGRLGIFSGYSISSFNPEAGLTLTRTYTAGSSFSFTNTERQQNAVFACDITFPTTAVDGVLFEAGGNVLGFYAGTRDSSGTRTFRLRSSDGGSKTGSTTDTVVIDYQNYPLDGLTRTLVWDIDINPGTIRFWIDGVLIQEGTTTGGGALDNFVWCGSATAGYTTSPDGVVPTGESSAAWGGTAVSSLRYYQNQNVIT